MALADTFGNAIGNSIVTAGQSQSQTSAEDLTASRDLEALYSRAISDTDTKQQLLDRFGLSEIPNHVGTDIALDPEKQLVREKAMELDPTLTLEEAEQVANLLDAKRDVDDINGVIATSSPSIARDNLTRTARLLLTILINKDVYFNSSISELLPSGIHRVAGSELSALGFSQSDFVHEDSGYFGALYRNDTISRGPNQYVYANRGTDSGVDWLANGKDALGFSTTQFEYAIELGQRLGSRLNGNLEFTGHSLGGGLAAAQSLATGLDAITLNAKGLSSGTISRFGLNVNDSDNIAAFEIEGELLSGLQDNLLVEGFAKTIGTLGKNIVAGGSAVIDFLSGNNVDTNTFGLASVDQAYGNRVEIPAFNLQGEELGFFGRVGNTLNLHSVDYIGASTRSSLYNGSLTPDLLQYIKIR